MFALSLSKKIALSFGNFAMFRSLLNDSQGKQKKHEN